MPWDWVPDDWVSPPEPAAPADLDAAPELGGDALDWGSLLGAPAAPPPPPPPPPPVPAPDPFIEAMEADAVSGGYAPPLEWTPPPTPEPDPLDPIDVEADRLRGLHPITQAGEMARADAEEEQDFAGKTIAALEASRREGVANHEALQQVQTWARQERETILAKSQEVEKIDPDRWWSSRSTGQKIAGLLSAAIGGWLEVARGVPNRALDAITAAVNQDIDAQKFDIESGRRGLETQRGLVAEFMRDGMDAFSAGEAARIGALNGMLSELQAKRAEFDPAGSTARRIVAAEGQVAGAIADANAKLEAALWDRGHKVAQLQQQDISSRRSTGLGYAQIKESRTAREQAATERQEQREHEAEMAARKAEAGRGTLDGSLIDEGVRTVVGVDDSGRRVYAAARGADHDKELSRRKVATDKIVSIGTRLKALRKEVGWTSNTMNSEQNNRMRQLGEELKLALASREGITYSERAANTLGKVAGGDPTAFLDSTDFIDEAINSTIEGWQHDVATRTSYEGPPLSPSTEGAAAPPSLEESMRGLTTDLVLDGSGRPIGDGWNTAKDRIAMGEAMTEEAIRGAEHRRAVVANLRMAREQEQARIAEDRQRFESLTGAQRSQALNRLQEREQVLEWIDGQLQRAESPDKLLGTLDTAQQRRAAERREREAEAEERRREREEQRQQGLKGIRKR
jgi:hypothetical protein